jgi:hypothetical protein
MPVRQQPLTGSCHSVNAPVHQQRGVPGMKHMGVFCCPGTTVSHDRMGPYWRQVCSTPSPPPPRPPSALVVGMKQAA